MKNSLKWLCRRGRELLIYIIFIFIGFLTVFEVKAPLLAEEEFFLENLAASLSELVMIQENSLLPIVELSSPEPQIMRKIEVIITAYSSTPWETDNSPYITAAGTVVRDGIVANNVLPFGTKIKIPELYGDKIFVVEDRMSWTKGNYHIDIWFPSYWQAKNFGVKKTYIEILKD